MKRDARGKRTSLTNVVSRPCQSVTVVLCRADIENRLCLMYVRGAENRDEDYHGLFSFLQSGTETRAAIAPLATATTRILDDQLPACHSSCISRRYVFWCLGPLSLHLVSEECGRRRRSGRKGCFCVPASSGTNELGKRHGQRRAVVSAPPPSLSHNGMNGVRWQVRGVCMERVSLHVRVLQPKHLCMGLV